LADFLTSSLALDLSGDFGVDFAGDFVVRGTGFTFIADLAGSLACGLEGVLTTFSFAWAGVPGLIGFLATGFAVGFASFPDF
jgi:hypothetical protein